MDVLRQDKQTWVVRGVDAMTVAAIKDLASVSRQSMGHTLDQAVEYFCRKIVLSKDKPLRWELPDDF